MSLRLLTGSALLLAAVNLPCGAMKDVVKAPRAQDVVNVGSAHLEGEKKAKRDTKPIRERQVAFKEETSLGGAVAVRFVSGGGNLLMNDALHRYLNRVGKNLGAQSARPTIPWTFGVMKSKDFNAVSAPGGYVFVAAGLLKQVDNEAQLAGVLAHEIAHITQKHAMKAYNGMLADKCTSAAFAKRDKAIAKAVANSLDSPAFMDSITSKLGAPGGLIDFDSADGIALLGPVVSGLTDVLVKGYSHEDEYEADRIAVDLLVSAGYNPHEYVNFLGRIPTSGGLLTSHPDKGDRQKELREYLKELASSNDFGAPADYTKYAVVKLKNEPKVVKK